MQTDRSDIKVACVSITMQTPNSDWYQIAQRITYNQLEIFADWKDPSDAWQCSKCIYIFTELLLVESPLLEAFYIKNIGTMSTMLLQELCHRQFVGNFPKKI